MKYEALNHEGKRRRRKGGERGMMIKHRRKKATKDLNSLERVAEREGKKLKKQMNKRV